MRRLHGRRRWLIVLAVALALFIAFEVGIRLVMPDAVEVTVNFVGCTDKSVCVTITPPSEQSGGSSDPRAIAMYQALLAPPNESQSLLTAYLTAWTGKGCPPVPITPYNKSERFIVA